MTPRFLVAPEALAGAEVALTGDAAHHLRDVLRLRDGDPVVLFDGEGREAAAVVLQARRHEARLGIRRRSFQPPPTVDLVLVQAVPKAAKMDLIVQKATELGVRRICPVLTERGLSPVDDARENQRRLRWVRIAVGAAEQCGTNWLPRIDLPMPLSAFLNGSPVGEAAIVGSLYPGAEPLARVLAEIRRRRPGSLAAFIGPEGDFTPGEMDSIRSSGVKPVRFGTRVLRVETAALYVMAVMAYELLDSGEIAAQG